MTRHGHARGHRRGPVRLHGAQPHHQNARVRDDPRAGYGRADVHRPTTATFVTTVNVAGGSKQFAAATGHYVATGQLDFVTGEATGTFTSTVCK
jgi:hypothetical protein